MKITQLPKELLCQIMKYVSKLFTTYPTKNDIIYNVLATKIPITGFETRSKNKIHSFRCLSFYNSIYIMSYDEEETKKTWFVDYFLRGEYFAEPIMYESIQRQP